MGTASRVCWGKIVYEDHTSEWKQDFLCGLIQWAIMVKHY